jgi:hypothetical protein
MNCQNCGIEIPPTWTAALTANVCPACGQPIMGEEIQTLIKDLSEALKIMPANAEAIAGWVVSNYKLTKIGSYDPSQVQVKGNKPKTAVNGGNIAKTGGVITAADLLKQAKTGIDTDDLMQRAYEARNNIPPPIVEDDLDYGLENEVEEDGFDADKYSQKQLARVMGKMQGQVPQVIEEVPMSKHLVIETNRTFMKQQEAKEAILSEAPRKNGFCRAAG